MIELVLSREGRVRTSVQQAVNLTIAQFFCAFIRDMVAMPEDGPRVVGMAASGAQFKSIQVVGILPSLTINECTRRLRERSVKAMHAFRCKVMA